MLILENGDLFTIGAQAIVNATNTNNGGNGAIPHGLMGGGLARVFATRYPDMATDYYRVCEEGFEPGNVHVWDNPKHGEPGEAQYIINFPTKREITQNSKLEYVEKGLVALNRAIQDRDIGSIALPALGCGLGGLSWNEVRPLIVAWATDVVPDVRVHLFLPK